MSVAKTGGDDHELRHRRTTTSCTRRSAGCTAGGITVVAAAANDHTTAPQFVPLPTTRSSRSRPSPTRDGKSGGLGGNRCYSWGTYDVDDTFADFSNYGGDVDIIAPGQVHLVDCSRSGLRLFLRHLDGRARGDRRRRPLQGQPSARHTQRGPRVASLPRQPRLEDLDRPGQRTTSRCSTSAAWTRPRVRSSGRGDHDAGLAASPAARVTVPVNVEPQRRPSSSESASASRACPPAGPRRWAPRACSAGPRSATTATITVPKTARARHLPAHGRRPRTGAARRPSTVTCRGRGHAPSPTSMPSPAQIEWLYSEGITDRLHTDPLLPDAHGHAHPDGDVPRPARSTSPTTTTDYFDDDDGRTGEASVNALAQGRPHRRLRSAPLLPDRRA